MTKSIGRRRNLKNKIKERLLLPTVLRLAQDKRRDRNDGVTLFALEWW
jgi:hypothetical protein